MTTFDAPSREICTVRRIRSNTPLQAFVTLNDPVYVEVARALARRVLREGGTTVQERAEYALRLCLCRPPVAEQVTTVLTLLQSEQSHFREDQKAALELVSEQPTPAAAQTDVAELAAWTVIANVLLNMDAILTKS
jgi:hypothetical protein